MTTKRGAYTIDVRGVEHQGVRISGYLTASSFVHWDLTPYGREPKLLVELLIRSLLPDIPTERYTIHEIRFTSFGTSTAPERWGAIVTGDEDVVRILRSKIGTRAEGVFSFEEASLIGTPTVRPYPDSKGR